MIPIEEIVIIDAARTPIGSFLGNLSEMPAPKLGSTVIKEIIERIGIDSDLIDEVIMGNVLPAGTGQAPARQAALGAGLSTSTSCMTINKVCGSGLKAVMLACQSLMLEDSAFVFAGGMENMSLVPYYLPDARKPMKMGNKTIIDGMIKDGLWDVYNDFHMGKIAELCAEKCGISREEQDRYAVQSYNRALNAIEKHYFENEIIPVEIPGKKGDTTIVNVDEEPFKVKFDKIRSLKPVFDKNGTVTAANASSINDGASALLLTTSSLAAKYNLKPLAKIKGYSTASKDPEWFTSAPEDSINKLLYKTGYSIKDIDLWEINEAFSVVALKAISSLKLSEENVNINGGAVSLGHPIGASGARILTTLIHSLIAKDKKTGIASICIGGGEAVSVMVEKL